MRGWGSWMDHGQTRVTYKVKREIPLCSFSLTVFPSCPSCFLSFLLLPFILLFTFSPSPFLFLPALTLGLHFLSLSLPFSPPFPIPPPPVSISLPSSSQHGGLGRGSQSCFKFIAQ